jgi:hypothetical protein
LPLRRFVQWRVPGDADHQRVVDRLRRQLRESRAGLALATYTEELELAALVLLVLAPQLLEAAPRAEVQPAALTALTALTALDQLEPELAAEIELLRQQLRSLRQAADVESSPGCEGAPR